MKTRSYVSSAPRALRSAARASAWRISATPGGTASVARLARSAFAADASRSTNTALAAPRESASMPSPPAPANRSRTLVPATSPSSANRASLTRSDVGLVALPRGAFRRLPRYSPAITRTRAALSRYRLQGLAAEPALERRGEQRVLGHAQLRVDRQRRFGERARPLLQRRVLGQAGHPELAQARLTR